MTCYDFPAIPISVVEIQGYLVHHPLDCTLNSREVMALVEDHFGYRIRIATLVLACLWSGYACLPHNHGKVFRFCKFETYE